MSAMTIDEARATSANLEDIVRRAQEREVPERIQAIVTHRLQKDTDSISNALRHQDRATQRVYFS